MIKEKILKALQKGYLPYIKPTTFVHDSKFRIFEVGYCKIDKKNNKIKNKIVLGKCSDHIQISSYSILGRLLFDSVNIDLTRDGYIRFFVWDEGRTKGCFLKWDNDDFVVSSARLLVVRKEVKNGKG